MELSIMLQDIGRIQEEYVNYYMQLKSKAPKNCNDCSCPINKCQDFIPQTQSSFPDVSPDCVKVYSQDPFIEVRYWEN